MASRKRKTPSEVYKTRHKIGRRTAAERVGSYNDSEFNVSFPTGYWEAVRESQIKKEAQQLEYYAAQAKSDARQKPNDDDEVSAKRRSKSPEKKPDVAVKREKSLTPKPSSSKPSSSKVSSKGKSELKVDPKTPESKPADVGKVSKPKSSGKGGRQKKVFDFKEDSPSPLPTSPSKGNNGLVEKMRREEIRIVLPKFDSPEKAVKKLTERRPSPVGREKPTNLKTYSKKPASSKEKSKDVTRGVSKQSKNIKKTADRKSKPIVLPRAPRIRRTACLTAGAIVSALLESKPKSETKHKSDSDVTKTGPNKTEKGASGAKTSKNTTAKTTLLKTAKKKITKMKNDAVKKVKKARRKWSKVTSSDSSDDQPSDNDEEDEDEETVTSDDDDASYHGDEDKSPKKSVTWQPPKRMASINAQAIWTACKENDRHVNTERAARTQRFSRSEDREEGKTPAALKTPDKSKSGHWMDGRADALADNPSLIKRMEDYSREMGEIVVDDVTDLDVSVHVTDTPARKSQSPAGRRQQAVVKETTTPTKLQKHVTTPVKPAVTSERSPGSSSSHSVTSPVKSPLSIPDRKSVV